MTARDVRVRLTSPGSGRHRSVRGADGGAATTMVATMRTAKKVSISIQPDLLEAITRRAKRLYGGNISLSKIVQKPVYKSLTVRNWNTTTKLLAMRAE
jgi:uncharacterized protein (DUF1697 family)